MRKASSRRLIELAVTISILFQLVGLAYSSDTKAPDFRNAFHLVGVPKVQRDQRIDISLADAAVVFQHKKVVYEVPYQRIRRVLLLQGNRVYEKSSYAAAVALGFPGALLILKKHHVDTVVFDYLNERGGLTGIVVQVETGQGLLLRKLLDEKGVAVDEPAPSAETNAKPEAGVDLIKRRK